MTTGTIRPLPSASSTAKPRLIDESGDDLVAADLAVDPRVALQRLDDRARDEDQVRRVDAVLLLVLRLQPLADRDDPRHVDLDRARHVRGRVERAAHVLGDAAAHGGHRLELLAGALPSQAPAAGAAARLGGGRGRGRSGLLARSRAPAPARERRAGAPDSTKLRMSFFVTRPPRPGAGHRADVDAVLGRDPRDDRRDEALAVVLAVVAPGRLPEPEPERGLRRGAGSGARRGSSSPAARPAGSRRAGAAAAGLAADDRELRPDVDRLAFRHEDLRDHAGSRGSAPRCRPCRSRSRAATRRPRSARPPAFSHFVIVPSETETPICGMTTSTASVVAIPISTRPALAVLRPRLRPAG